MRSKFFANEFAHIHGLQSETGTPARNALIEHYPATGLKIPLTAFVLDTSGRGFDNPAEPPALHEHPNFPEFMIFNFRCIFRDLIDESPPACVKNAKNNIFWSILTAPAHMWTGLSTPIFNCKQLRGKATPAQTIF